MARRTKVAGLPPDVRAWLDKALADSNFSDYEELEKLLAERGFSIGKSSIHRYGQKLEAKLAAVKASTEAARAIAEAAPDDSDLRSAAVMSMAQTEFFNIFVALQEASAEDDPGKRLKMMGVAAKGISELSRASVNQKKWEAQVRTDARAELLREQAAELDKTVQAGGMDEEQAMFWRKKFLGVQ